MTASDFARCDLCPSPCEHDTTSELFQSAIGDFAAVGPDLEVASVSETATVVSDITSGKKKRRELWTESGRGEILSDKVVFLKSKVHARTWSAALWRTLLFSAQFVGGR